MAQVPVFKPEDGTYTMFPHEMYGWFDFSMGLVLGSYVTLNTRAKNGDCSSRLFGLGVSVADYHKNYDRKWEHLPLRWILIVFKVAFDAYAVFMMMDTCIKQLAFSSASPWLAAYKNKTLLPESAKVQISDVAYFDKEKFASIATEKEESSYSLVSSDWEMPSHIDGPIVGEAIKPLKVVVWCFGIISDGVGIWMNITSNFYWYNLGKNLTGLIMKMFILLDHVTGSTVITPTNPWLRYN